MNHLVQFINSIEYNMIVVVHTSHLFKSFTC